MLVLLSFVSVPYHTSTFRLTVDPARQAHALSFSTYLKATQAVIFSPSSGNDSARLVLGELGPG